MELFVNLKDILKEKDISQKRLAELTGLTEAQVSAIASNRTTTINKVHIAKIANALESLEMDRLFSWK